MILIDDFDDFNDISSCRLALDRPTGVISDDIGA